jgi:NADH-quinone oxidoreductase subunit F
MVVDAIAAGRRAAMAIDKYLRGDTSRVDVHERKTGVIAGAAVQEIEETWDIQPRLAVRTLPVPERRASFAEIELGFSEEVAIQEAKRCLRCDLES